MEGFELENKNKKEGEKEEGEKKESGTASTDSLENYRASLEEIKEELKLEEIEEKLNDIQSLGSFFRKEKEALEEKKESRTKTFLRKAFIGATLMACLWSAGKMGVSKAEASESNTQTEQQESQEGKATEDSSGTTFEQMGIDMALDKKKIVQEVLEEKRKKLRSKGDGTTFEQMGIEMADNILLKFELMKIQDKVAELQEIHTATIMKLVELEMLKNATQLTAETTENLEEKENAENLLKVLDKAIPSFDKLGVEIAEEMGNLLKEAEALVSQHKSKNR